MTRRCSGCGSEFQDIDSTKPGYLPEEKYNEVLNNDSNIICMRCFKIKNYGQNISVEITENDYKNEVKKIVNSCKAVLLIIDIIDFEGSYDKTIIDTVKDKPIILVINKIDLVPNALHPSEISNWIKTQIDEELNILDIAIISTKSNYGVNGIIKKLKYFYKDGGNIGVVGVTNVGKSSLINRFLDKKQQIVESKYAGTTLKTINKKIPKTNFNLIDTPGLIPKGRASDLLCTDCGIKLIPSKEISRKTFKLKKNRVIFIGGLIKIKFIVDSDIKPIFSIYASNDVVFHETNEEKAEQLKSENLGDLLYPPCTNCKEDFKKFEFIKKEFTIDSGKEFVIKGLGWINIKRGPVKFEIEMPENIYVREREALIKPRRE